MRLRELVKNLDAAQVDGGLDREIAGVTADWRRVRPGMLFVALPEDPAAAADPESIPLAIDRGAAAVVAEHSSYPNPRATRICVVNAYAAFARASASLYPAPGGEMKLIGVSGPGARAVAWILHHLLATADQPGAVLTAAGALIGARDLPGGAVESAADWMQVLAEARRAACPFAIVEVASPLPTRSLQWEAMAWLQGATPDPEVGTNSEYVLSAAPENEGEIGLALQSGDEPLRRWSARLLESTLDGSRFVMGATRQLFRCELPLVGGAALQAAIRAIALARQMNVPTARLQNALKRVRPIPGELEKLSGAGELPVFVDGARSAAQLRQTLTTLRPMVEGKLHVVMGANGASVPADLRDLAAALAPLADRVCFTSDNPGHSAPGGIAAGLAGFYEAHGGREYEIVVDRCDAIDRVVRRARKGDVVLVAGKGRATFQEIGGARVPFDDRAHARAALDARRRGPLDNLLAMAGGGRTLAGLRTTEQTLTGAEKPGPS